MSRSTTQILGKNERTAEFANDLLTTTKAQAQKTLAAVVDRPFQGGVQIGYCCLGLKSADLCLVTIDSEAYEHPAHFAMGDALVVIDDTSLNLAPVELAEWFGYDMAEYRKWLAYVPDPNDPEDFDHVYEGVDFRIAWDDVRARPDKAAPLGEDGRFLSEDGTTRTLSTLNDAGFTFKQIGDIVAYFGLGRCTW